jgi:hypothetical protein
VRQEVEIEERSFVAKGARQIPVGSAAGFALDATIGRGDIRRAIAREKQIKEWLRAKKVALIELRIPSWKDLAEPYFALRKP